MQELRQLSTIWVLARQTLPKIVKKYGGEPKTIKKNFHRYEISKDNTPSVKYSDRAVIVSMPNWRAEFIKNAQDCRIKLYLTNENNHHKSIKPYTFDDSNAELLQNREFITQIIDAGFDKNRALPEVLQKLVAE